MESKRFLISQDRVLQYYSFGNGNRTIVMLHAQGTSSESYFEVAEHLAKSSKVILVDYYGHGGSTHNADLYQDYRRNTPCFSYGDVAAFCFETTTVVLDRML